MKILLALVAIAIIVFIIRKKRKPTYKDIVLPMPESRRSDLLYGYYSSLDRSYDQTKDHINLFWYSNFFGYDKLLEILKETTCKVVLDVAVYITERNGKTTIASANAESNLRDYFIKLKNDGVLQKVSYLYPIDEPNLSMSESEHLKIIQVVKKVVAEFDELRDARLLVIYGRGKPFWNIGEFDVVGVDDYDQKSEILTIGEHARLKREMKPGQRTALVPGCGFGQNPDPFVAYALSNPDEVEMVVPFIWFDDPNHKDVPYTGLENADPALRDSWIHAANICLNRE